MTLYYTICAAIGYLIGSIPAGFLLVQRQRSIDLRTTGSGNVGAMNAFEVSGSKFLGAGVMLFDALKGVSAVLVALALFGGNFPLLAAAATGAVIGHNYPVWLRWKGGRGLATGAGAMLLVGWIFPLLWMALWASAYSIWKNIHGANILATLFAPVAIVLIPGTVFTTVLPFPASHETWIVATIVVSLPILLRHIGPARELWNSFSQPPHIGS